MHIEIIGITNLEMGRRNHGNSEHVLLLLPNVQPQRNGRPVTGIRTSEKTAQKIIRSGGTGPWEAAADGTWVRWCCQREIARQMSLCRPMVDSFARHLSDRWRIFYAS